MGGIPGDMVLRGLMNFIPQNRGKDIEVEVSPGVREIHPNLGRAVSLAGRNVRDAPEGARGTRGIKTHDFFKAGLLKLTNKNSGLPHALETYLYDVTGLWGREAQIHRNVSACIGVFGRFGVW